MLLFFFRIAAGNIWCRIIEVVKKEAFYLEWAPDLATLPAMKNIFAQKAVMQLDFKTMLAHEARAKLGLHC